MDWILSSETKLSEDEERLDADEEIKLELLLELDEMLDELQSGPNFDLYSGRWSHITNFDF